MKSIASFIVALAAGGAGGSVWGQLALNSSGTYSQNFDALPSSGASNVWSNNNTLAGWSAQRVVGAQNTIAASTGSSSNGSLYSFGSSGDADRALGSVGASSTGNLAWGVSFQNASAQTLTFGSLQYVGELWRRATPVEAETLSFSYLVSNSAISDLFSGTWTPVSALDFTNPNAPTPTGAVDGNLAANRVSLSSPLTLSLMSGQFVFFRWLDLDHGGNDNGLAIDDFSVSYTLVPPAFAAVPEPATFAMAGLSVLAAAVALRRRRK
jgi:MYXO-CTERM domain-containing protein